MISSGRSSSSPTRGDGTRFASDCSLRPNDASDPTCSGPARSVSSTFPATSCRIGGNDTDARSASPGRVAASLGARPPGSSSSRQAPLFAPSRSIWTRGRRRTPRPFPTLKSCTRPTMAPLISPWSATGTLVFLAPGGAGASVLEWIDRTGRREPLAPGAGQLFLSPNLARRDSRRARRRRPGCADIWILDIARLALSRLSDGPTDDMLAAWSPDGARVFYSSNRHGNFDVYYRDVDVLLARRW